VGRKGLTDANLAEISRRLKHEGVLKVRVGVDVEDRREFAQQVSERLGAELVEVRGYTFIVRKIDSRAGGGSGTSQRKS